MKQFKFFFLIVLIGSMVLATSCGKRGKPVYEGGTYPRSYPSE